MEDRQQEEKETMIYIEEGEQDVTRKQDGTRKQMGASKQNTEVESKRKTINPHVMGISLVIIDSFFFSIIGFTLCSIIHTRQSRCTRAVTVHVTG